MFFNLKKKHKNTYSQTLHMVTQIIIINNLKTRQ